MFYILLSALLFGLVHPGAKFLLGEGLSLLPFCFAYILFRFAVQIPFVLRSRSFVIQSKKQFGLLVAIGLVGAGLQYSEFSGIAAGLPVPLVSFLVYSHPVWGACLGRLINGEKFTFQGVLQILSGLLGMALITGAELFAGHYALLAFAGPLIAAVLIALWVSLSSLAKKSGVSSLTLSFYYDFFACLAIGSLYLRTSTGAVGGELWYWLQSPSHIFQMLFYSTAVGLLPNLLFYRGASLVSARAAGLLLLTEPLVSTLVSQAFWPGIGREALSATFFVGAFFVLLAGAPLEASSWLTNLFLFIPQLPLRKRKQLPNGDPFPEIFTH